MTEKSRPPKKIEFRGSRDSNYLVYQIDGVYGGLDPEKGSLIFLLICQEYRLITMVQWIQSQLRDNFYSKSE